MSEIIEYRANLGIGAIELDPRMETETERRDARAQELELEPSLTLAIFRTRSLRSFATPCHGRGASF
jgi:hypothetical protein